MKDLLGSLIEASPHSAPGGGSREPYLYRVDGVHDSVFLLRSVPIRRASRGPKVRLTAIPANAPAAMFCSREKFGGRDS